MKPNKASVASITVARDDNKEENANTKAPEHIVEKEEAIQDVTLGQETTSPGSENGSSPKDKDNITVTESSTIPQLTDTITRQDTSASEKPYSSYTLWEKRFIVLTATLGAFFSPFTAQIYFPALNTLAKDLHVSPSKINLTITTYMVRYSHLYYYHLYSIILMCVSGREKETVLTKLPDFASHSTSIHRQFIRHGGKKTGIHYLFCYLYCCGYCIGVTK
jgi:hypothetical protein